MDYTKYAGDGVYSVDTDIFKRAGGSAPMGAVYAAVDAAASAAARAFKAVHNTWQERAAIRELSALDDQILDDIGVPRPEIRVMVRKMMENPGVDHRLGRK